MKQLFLYPKHFMLLAEYSKLQFLSQAAKNCDITYSYAKELQTQFADLGLLEEVESLNKRQRLFQLTKTGVTVLNALEIVNEII